MLLVEPPKPNWEMMGDYVAPPLGLAQLAAILESNKVDVNIIDCNASKMSWADLNCYLARSRPDLVGATALTPFFYEAQKVTELAKELNPDIITVLGGPHVTYTAEETLSRYPNIDVIVCGEGDITFPELLQCLEDSRDLSQVKGLAFRKNGEIKQTAPQQLVDVDKLPLPAYHLLPMEAYRFPVFGKFTTVLTSRGCPHRCTFCSEWRFWGEQWRPRDVRQVVDEIELLRRRYHIKSLWFGDDCFNIGHERIESLCREIINRNLDVWWFYQGRADLVLKHQDLLPLMRKAGNRLAQIGIEASTDKELTDLNKSLTVKQIKEAVKLLKKNDILAQGLIIVGTRQDDAASIIHKLRFMKWLDVDHPVFTLLTPFPGSDIYNGARQNGWCQTLDYSLYDMAHVIMPTAHLSRGQVMYWYAWCYQSYYFDLIKLAKGLFSRNHWKRAIWHLMISYSLKQMARHFFTRQSVRFR